MGLEFAHETQLDCSAEKQAVLLREIIGRTYGGAHFGQTVASGRTTTASGEDGDDKDRAAKRHPLIWSGVLHFNGSSAPIRVRNISATGAMVQCRSKVPAGADAILELGESLSLPASIGWVVGDQVGLRFGTEFDVTQLARSTPEVAPQRWVRPAYLDKSEAPPSPWDPKWQRLTIGEMGQELEGFLKR
jgi:PilZ domain